MFTVWLCCRNYDEYDTKEEAFEEAHWATERDGDHQPISIEGPDHEDLTSEWTRYHQEQSDKEWSRSTAYRLTQEAKFIGTLEIKSPRGDWCPQRMYDMETKNAAMANAWNRYGPDRVRYISA